jgi:hypothetical protein
MKETKVVQEEKRNNEKEEGESLSDVEYQSTFYVYVSLKVVSVSSE